MKASKLISILASHVCEHGDYEVVIFPADCLDRYETVTNCWYNYGKDWGDTDRIIISHAINTKENQS